MKVVELLSGIGLAITNEERDFLDKHPGNLKISNLDEHNTWIAQNLIRKGVYSISKDNILVNNLNDKKSSNTL